METHAVIGMGSNKGSPEKKLLAAAKALEHVPGITPVGLSSGYVTTPVGPSQPSFLNAAMALTTSLSPAELLAALLGIEAGLGRRRDVHLGPRFIDLDLLVMEDHVANSEHLILPHPRLPVRAFALVPLVEIAPDAADPVTGKLYRDILRGVGIEGVGPAQPLPSQVNRKDFDHTADLGFSVVGRTLGEVLENAAMGLVDLMVDRSRVIERERHLIEIKAQERVDLLVGLLSELVFLLDARGFVARRISHLAQERDRVVLAAYGETLHDEQEIPSKENEEIINTYVKAVTYHNAFVERDRKNGRWQASVVVDV